MNTLELCQGVFVICYGKKKEYKNISKSDNTHKSCCFKAHGGKKPVWKYIKMPIATVSSFSVVWEEELLLFFFLSYGYITFKLEKQFKINTCD